MGAKRRLHFPQTLLGLHLLFAGVVGFLGVLYLGIQFFISYNARSWIEVNSVISEAEIRVNALLDNTLELEAVLLRYAKDAPLASQGKTSEFHPFKLEIERLTKEHRALLDRIVCQDEKRIKEQFWEHSRGLTDQIERFMGGVNSPGETELIQKETAIHFHFLKAALRKEMQMQRQRRQRNLRHLRKLLCRNCRLVGALFVAFLLALWLTWLFRRKLVNKVETLKRYLSSISSMESIQKIKYEEYDELNPLVQLFNRVVERIQDKNSEIKRHLDFMESIFESSPDALITVNREGKITYYNTTAAEFTGLSIEQARGRSLFSLHPHFTNCKRHFERLAIEQCPITYEQSISEPRMTRYYQTTLLPLKGETFEGAVVRTLDTTEEKLKDNHLLQSQKMELVRDLIGGIAHDFNNILGGIASTVSIVKYDKSQGRSITEEKYEEYFNVIEYSTARASDLVSHLVSLAHKRESHKSGIDLVDSVEHILKICRNSFDKTIEISSDLPIEQACSYCDITQLHQVLLNICINASHAMTIMRAEGAPQGGTLHISLNPFDPPKEFYTAHPSATQKNYYQITIKDTGVGIAPENQKKIFNPFFTTKKANGGVGLGLSMVCSIIEQHNGVLTFDSQVGVGTAFHIFLPELSESEEIIVKEAVVPRGSGTLLFVEDEESLRKPACHFLEDLGYTVIRAKDGQEAQELFELHAQEIDLVLLDLVLPYKNGLELFESFRERVPDLKVLVMSGFIQDDRISKMLSLGARGFLKKPYTLEKLGMRVHVALAKEKKHV